MQLILSGIISAAIALAAQFGFYHDQTLSPQMQQAMKEYLANSQQNYGSTLPFAGNTYNLAGSGVSASATSIVLQSLTIKQTGQKIATADLGSIFYVTLEPGNNSKQEIVGCTGVTQAVSSATLTGCSRGLSPISPYTASSSLQFVHSGGSSVIFSNPPQLFNLYAALANANTFTAVQTFGSTTPPAYDFNPNFSSLSTTTFASTGYVAGIISGSSTIQVGGGGTGVNSFPVNNFIIGSGGNLSLTSTSSPTGGTFAATTSNATSTFAGHVGISGNLSAGTTTIGTTTINGTLTINSNAGLVKIALNTSPTAITGVSASTTVSSITIPGGTLSTGNTVRIRMYVSAYASTVGSNDYFEIAFGNATTTLFSNVSGAHSTTTGFVEIAISSAGTTNSQKITTLWAVPIPNQVSPNSFVPGGGVSISSTTMMATSTLGSVDSTQAQKFMFIVKPSSPADNFTTDQITAEVIK